MPSKRRAPENESPKEPGSNATPAVKRQRVSRACDQCRAAREKCDGIQPQCFPCLSQNRPCTYRVSPRKRGVQTGYIRTLELALGFVFDRVPAAEDALCAFLTQDGAQGLSVLTGKDPDSADRLHQRWRKGRIHKSIECILSGRGLPSVRTPSVDASDTEADGVRGCSNPDAVDASTHRAVGNGHGPPAGPTEEHQDDCSPPRVRRLRLPPNHWRLLDVYFSYTHSWLPVLEKQHVFQALYLYRGAELTVNPQEASSAVHAELWAALALASWQDASSSKLPSPDGPEAVGPSPTRVYDIARGLLPADNGPFQVQHARALLLLSLVNLGQDKLTAAGLLIGTAIRILLGTGGIGKDKQQQGTALVLMSCFMVDTILSVRCNRVPHLRAEDLAELPCVPEDRYDQWEPWTPCDGFGAHPAHSRSSRSPAFCMSTFNQLYAILKVVAFGTSPRRLGSPLEGPAAASLGRLQQVVDCNSPFGGLVASPDCPAASVPSAYIARATYLWACALADPRSEDVLSQLHDTLDQYEKLFGRCGMAPFLAPCIASLANAERLGGSGEQRQERLRRLVVAHSSTWNGELPSGTPVSGPDSGSVPARVPLAMASPVESSAPANFTMTQPAAAMTSLYSNSTMPRQHTHPYPTGRGYGSFESLQVTAPYQRPFTGHPVNLPQANNIHMHLGAGLATTRSSSDRPSQPPLPPAGFGSNPDYDALLDDLASIECTDAVDVDTQFMTNLGFAPGCDMAEILTRDFGRA